MEVPTTKEVSKMIDRRLKPFEEKLEYLLDTMVSQKEAARKINVTPATIINYERAGKLTRVNHSGYPTYSLKDVLNIKAND